MVVESFVPSLNQSIRVQAAKPRNYTLLNFGNGSEMEDCQVLYKRYKEINVAWCEIRAVERMFQCIPSEMVHQITCNRNSMQFDVVNNPTAFESIPDRFM